MTRPTLLAAALLALVALAVGGCGGGSSGGSSSGAPPSGSSSTAPQEGGPKKATAPNAPAGSKVVSCDEGRVETIDLRATEVDCETARTVMQRWESSDACTLGEGSRSSCALDGFRCQAVKVDKGASVSCAGPGGDVSFIAKAWLLKKSGG